jgi:hypothetical protein
MRVLVTGSRDWEGPWAEGRVHAVLRALEILHQTVEPNEPFVIVHGGCPTGADAIADRWARRRWYEPEVHPANWAAHGKAAGFLRNAEMVQMGADVCVGFLKDGSRGTSHTLALARTAGIWTIVIPWNPEDEQEPDDKLPLAA